MSSEAAISVRGLSKVYRVYGKPQHRLLQMATLGRVRPFREFPAVHDVSFDVFRGETVGIVGRNGSGKSTLLQMICGTLQPSGGSVAVKGRIAALLELGAGFNREFTGRENVYMNGAILGFAREEMDARMEGIARFASIGEFLDQPVKTYSSGMFVRLAFAVATAVEPDILVVDEALSVGDEAFQRKCFARIESIKERGGTILFVSHGAQTIVQLCSRAVLIEAGEKLLEGTPKLVVGHYQRFVNASAAAAPALREELRALGRSGPLPEPERTDDKPPAASPVPKPAPEPEPEAEDFFDPDLRSESRLEYESKHAEIGKVEILDKSNRRRNILVRRRRYAVAYEVAFSRPARDVAFGFMISTVSGLGVGGAGLSTVRELQLREVAAGQRVRVRFAFDCLLLPGLYLVTVGCSGVQWEEREFLHRVLDACAFKVLPAADTIATGLVDLRVEPRIEVECLSPA